MLHDGRLVGKGGLHTIDRSLPKFEIGYRNRTSSTGQGVSRRDAEGKPAGSCMSARPSP